MGNGEAVGSTPLVSIFSQLVLKERQAAFKVSLGKEDGLSSDSAPELDQHVSFASTMEPLHATGEALSKPTLPPAAVLDHRTVAHLCAPLHFLQQLSAAVPLQLLFSLLAFLSTRPGKLGLEANSS